ncbi:MAG: DUF2868 domain-containing protein [Pseudomonadota bacterium]|nr:DUF2868 domain-containing protein [Pseudomonadota bacterium]
MPKPESSRTCAKHQEACLLAEAVRLRERVGGRLDDTVANSHAREAGGSDQARLCERAEHLAAGIGLIEALPRWRKRVRLLALAGLLLSFVLGVLSVQLGLVGRDGLVSLMGATVSLVGASLSMLLAWLVLGLKSRRSRPTPPLTLLLWLSRRAGLGPALWLGGGAVEVLRSQRRLWAASGVLTHALWLSALLGALLALMIAVWFTRYQFAWQTTVAPPGFFVALVDALGWLPGLLGFPRPDAEAVLASLNVAVGEPAAHRLWAWWLVGIAVAYGVLPRLLALLACLIALAAFRRPPQLDTTDPEWAPVLARLQPATHRTGVSDRDDVTNVIDHIAAPRDTLGGARHLLGLELHPGTTWPPALNMARLHVHQADAHAERKAALAHLGEERRARLLLAIDARNTPDRGLMRSIAECSHRAARTGVWLLCPEAGTSERVALWRDRLGEIGLPERDCITDQQDAARWLENDQ